jgi:hypothetical protein
MLLGQAKRTFHIVSAGRIANGHQRVESRCRSPQWLLAPSHQNHPAAGCAELLCNGSADPRATTRDQRHFACKIFHLFHDPK